MGVPANKIQVTHTLKVVTQEKVVAVVIHEDIHPLLRLCIDSLSQEKTRHHMKVFHLKRFMDCGLLLSAYLFGYCGDRDLWCAWGV